MAYYVVRVMSTSTREYAVECDSPVDAEELARISAISGKNAAPNVRKLNDINEVQTHITQLPNDAERFEMVCENEIKETSESA